MNIISKIYNLLSNQEKKRAGILMILILIMSIFDMLGIVSIYPFLIVLSNPELIETNKVLNQVYEFSSILGVNNNQEFLFYLGITVFIIFIVSLTFKATTHYFLVRFVLMREYSIARRLVEVYLLQPYSWFLNKHSADLGKNILSEVNNVTDRVLGPFINLIAQAVIIILILGILLFINAKIAIISFSIFGISYLLIYIMMNKKLKNIGNNNIERNKERAVILLEAFGAIKEVKMGGLEQTFIKRYDYPAVLYAKGYSLATIISQIPRFAMEGLGFGSMLLIVLYLMSLVDDFSVILPILSVYAFAAYRILPAIQQLYTSIATIRYSQSAIDLLYKDTNIKGNLNETNQVLDHVSNNERTSLKNQIRIENLKFKYPSSDSFVFDKLNISIKANTTVAFVGKTGSGKTTLIDLIIGLLKPNEGKLIIDDKEINDLNLRNWQKTISYVPQQVYISDDSITNNIAFGEDQEKINFEAVENAAKVANIHDFIINEMSKGYQTKVGERGIRLSGGQRQRIGIARAIYLRPDVLVLDEATSALDNITERMVMKALKNLNKEMTIIIIAHRLNTIKQCDVIHVLKDGKIKDSVSYDFLNQNNDYFKEMTKNIN